MQELASAEETKVSDKFTEDLGEKLKINVDEEKEEPEQEENGNEEEFSFVCLNPDGSPIAADDAFHNGQIRTIFPIFDQTLLYENARDDGGVEKNSQSLRPPLRKLFIEERSKPEEPSGPVCAWSSNKTVKEASPDSCKKSNSTGFSKLWRFRELVARSNSDGRDAFVFLSSNNNNNNDDDKSNSYEDTEKPEKSSKSTKTTTTIQETSISGKIKKRPTGDKTVKVETVSSAYEKHYVKNREMREGDKRKSYSPYRQDLVGFFTNVNGLSKNVHPF